MTIMENKGHIVTFFKDNYLYSKDLNWLYLLVQDTNCKMAITKNKGRIVTFIKDNYWYLKKLN